MAALRRMRGETGVPGRQVRTGLPAGIGDGEPIDVIAATAPGAMEITGNPVDEVRAFHLPAPVVRHGLGREEQTEEVTRDGGGAVAVAGMRGRDAQPVFEARGHAPRVEG